ncbi:uncharacterized protein PSFLO_06715 [Pseudozyma flocculosa]|uniref:Uncharacterized protein n=1 Tax=Pseudozyma flocculosa TaxID=84751 RepID=A0A5C3F9V8_9BASI|nr:uncharacterized protein PSFLO_06715 [Pseudozyma flocculosa]
MPAAPAGLARRLAQVSAPSLAPASAVVPRQVATAWLIFFPELLASACCAWVCARARPPPSPLAGWLAGSGWLWLWLCLCLCPTLLPGAAPTLPEHHHRLFFTPRIPSPSSSDSCPYASDIARRRTQSDTYPTTDASDDDQATNGSIQPPAHVAPPARDTREEEKTSCPPQPPSISTPLPPRSNTDIDIALAA